MLEITGEVAFCVRQHPISSGSVREGSVVSEVKIPFMAKGWLLETDPQMKRYLPRHCPWIRESLRAGEPAISPRFRQ